MWNIEPTLTEGAKYCFPREWQREMWQHIYYTSSNIFTTLPFESNINRSPADEASRTQNSANRASPKGAPDWLSFEYGELHLQDFLLCVLWARTHFSDSEKLLQLIRHTMWRRSVSSCINKKIITDIVVYYFVHYERQAFTKDLCSHSMFIAFLVSK